MREDVIREDDGPLDAVGHLARKPIHYRKARDMCRSRRQESLAAALMLLSTLCLGTPSASAATNQFRGVNWADQRDNFQSGVLYVSGLSSSDTYDSALAVGNAIMDQFISKLGANAVRMPINEATASQYWSTYTGAIDAVLSKGKVVLCYWDSDKSNKPPSMDAWWSMWQTAVDKYGSNENAYFEPFNEPNMYSNTDLNNLYNDWLTRYPTVPKGRVILDGTGNAQNVSSVGNDSRLKDCLLAVHDYSFFGSESMTSESEWENHIKGGVGSFADRTVCTEWGGPMSPGSKNGKSYDYLDYSKSPTNYFEGYIRGISNQLRAWNMGSFYWPGLRDGDWYSMTIKSGSGSNITLSIPNESGLDRLQYAWGYTPGSGGVGGSGGAGGSGPAGGAGGSAGSGGDVPAGGAATGGFGGGRGGFGGGRAGSGGATPTGGAGPTGGATLTGGASPAGGTASGGAPPAAGGTSSMGGASLATGGTAPATGGSIVEPSGGATAMQTGGATTSGGSTAQGTGGTSVVAAGAAAASESGGAAGASGSSGKVDTQSDESGCACRTSRSSSNPGALLALLGLCGLGSLGRRRRA